MFVSFFNVLVILKMRERAAWINRYQLLFIKFTHELINRACPTGELAKIFWILFSTLCSTPLKPLNLFLVNPSKRCLAIPVSKFNQFQCFSISAKIDLENELIRHFLIEPSKKGVRLKGSNEEPTFPSLVALIYQHSITKMALPITLLIPYKGKLWFLKPSREFAE